MATTVTQSELDKINQESSGTTSATSEEQTYTGKFVGTLIGNATTAKEFEAPYNFSLSGDATGTVAVNAKSVILETTVNHAKQADTADFAGKTNLSARASLADMANTAEFAYRAGKIAKIIINLTGVVTGKGESTNSESVDIEVTDFDASKQFVVGALATEPDTSKVYIDVAGKHLWIYDNTGAVWVDCFKQLADELDSHNLRIETLEGFNLNERVTNLEGQTSTLEEITADHESRITANKKVIDNHELRLNNIETTTDLGQVTLRITAIEAKNKEQDTSLEANATAIAKETSDREQAITTEAKAREDADNALGVRIDNADAKNTEQDTHLGTIDTHLETIDTHLGTIDEKNTAQDTALDTAKNELNTSISALSQKVQVNKADIDELKKQPNNFQVNNVYSFGMSQYYKGTMNNNSWLRSNNQWNSGTVYVDFYAWLLEHLNAGDAGFKSSTATDITDYDYVINTTDQTFRLPLLNGKETSIGSNYQSVTVKASGSTYTAPANGWFTAYNANGTNGGCWLNNITKHISSLSASHANFADGSTFIPVSAGDEVRLLYSGAFGIASGFFYFIPSKGDGNLYYYIGDTLQNATLINVARIEEKLTDLSSASRGYLVESYHKGTEWYRIYSDGWIEQGGVVLITQNNQTINLIRQMSNTDYTLSFAWSEIDDNSSVISAAYIKRTSSSFNVVSGYNGMFYNILVNWTARGY